LKFLDLQLETKLPIGARPGGVYVGESFYANKPHDLIFDHLLIRSCKYGMILYQNNIVVQNCSLELNGNQAEGQGIFCSASNVKFLNNVLDSNGCGSVFVHSIYISQTSDILFEGNEIKNADDGLKLRASNNLIIRNNKIHDTHIHSMHLGGDQASGCSNIIIEGNLCYNVPNGLRISSESGTQSLPTENVIVRNNIFPAMVQVSDNGPVKNIFFYNNLFHSAPGQPALWITNAANPQNIQLKNNLFYSTIPNNSHSLLSLIGSSGINGISLDHNLYYYPVGSRNILTVGNRTFQNLDSVGLLDLDNNNRIMDGDNDGKYIIDIGPYEFCCVVAVPKIKTSDQFYAFPNPSNNIIHLQFQEVLPDYVSIFNVHGKEMYVVQPKDIQQQIDISAYPSGCYWISISYFNNSNQTIKFLKL
jgi:parallel beta-helix repeat protein